MIWLRRDVAYALGLIWAFAGIVIKQADTQLVAGTACIMALALAILLVANIFRVKPAPVPETGLGR
jgi:hypothetical protein